MKLGWRVILTGRNLGASLKMAVECKEEKTFVIFFSLLGGVGVKIFDGRYGSGRGSILGN